MQISERTLAVSCAKCGIDSGKKYVILCTRSSAWPEKQVSCRRAIPQPDNQHFRWDVSHEPQTTVGEEASMVAELDLLDVWIPEQMQPGTMFMLEQAAELGTAENPYTAVLACPSCGSLGLITRQQCAGLEAMICGAEDCSAAYFLEGQTIRYRLSN
jgi:hypothetical protein